MTSRFIAALCCTSALCAVSAFDGARAQQGDQPAASSGAGQLEEIVVTARKTEEKLQVAPVSVTALSAAKLEAQNVTSAVSLNGLAPNLNISQGSGYGTSLNVTIRGVNQADNVLTNDAPVALYLDGVYMGRQMGGLFDMVDLERVEVLRGPQGTLFGRNTTGGAIDFITRKPENEFWVEQKTSFGSYNDFRSRTEINTGLIADTGLKALIAYSHHQNDGYVRALSQPEDNGFGSLASDSFYLDLHGDIGDEFSFDYRVDYTNEHDMPLADSLTVMSPVNLAFFGASPKFGGQPLQLNKGINDPNLGYNAGPPNHDEFYGHSLTMNYDVSDELRLKSITAYRSFADDSHSDQTGQGLLKGPVIDFSKPGFVGIEQIGGFTTLCPGNTPVFPSTTCDHQRQYQWSQEFQATGTIGEFKYVGGLFFFSENVHEQDPEFLTIAVPALAPVLEAFGYPAAVIPTILSNPALKKTNGTIGINAFPVANYYADSKSYAAYGQVSYRPEALDDKFEFTAGLRYTFDQKSISLRDFSATAPGCYTDSGIPGVCGGWDGAKSFHNLNYLVSGNYQFTDDLMAYFRISSGYKAGGFSARTPRDSYEPEVATAYEGGVKSEWLDHRLRINADFFYTEYDNAQINVFTQDPITHAAASVTENAGALTYMGGELEFSFIPAKNWLIDGSFGYVDPQFQQFLTVVPPSTVKQNYASQAIDNYTSKMTYAIGLQYDFDPFSFGDLSVRMDYNFASPKTFHPLTALSPLNDIIKSTNYHNLSAYVLLKNIETEYGTWQAKFFGANLLDEQQRYAGIDFEIVSGISYFGNNSYNPPRTFGGEITYKFEPITHTEAPAAYVPPPVQAPAPAPKSYLVFFDFNKSDLTPQAKDIVDTAAKNASANKVTQLTVTGHTDTVGSDAYNMRLSRRRAESVAAQLEKDGIASSEISIVAKGKRDLLVPTADGVREPQNRRVQIVFDGGPTS
jgi:iron complex outermembrane receptor protein